MTTLLRLHAWLLVAGLALDHSVIVAQSPPTLEALTVPPDQLPKGCQLEVSAPDAASPTAEPGRTPVRGAPIQSNPWSGTDVALKLEARNAVDGQPPMPYAPATRRELGAFQAKWVENVAEAYRARYESDDNGSVLVRAVRFDDATWATPEPPLGTRVMGGISARIVLGAIVARVSARASSECFQAVRKHLQSLTASGRQFASGGRRQAVAVERMRSAATLPEAGVAR